MLAFQLLNYHIVVDPVYGLDVLNHMWATEPVGTTGILLTCAGLMLTLAFKLMDFCWDIYREGARQGRLKVELSVEQVVTRVGKGGIALFATVSNTGKEPLVVRDIGYAKSRLLGQEFVRVVPQETPLPHALNAYGMVRIPIAEGETDLNLLISNFRVKDSLGKIWDAPDVERRIARRQLKTLRHALANQSASIHQTPSMLAGLNSGVAPPISTQN